MPPASLMALAPRRAPGRIKFSPELAWAPVKLLYTSNVRGEAAEPLLPLLLPHAAAVAASRLSATVIAEPLYLRGNPFQGIALSIIDTVVSLSLVPAVDRLMARGGLCPPVLGSSSCSVRVWTVAHEDPSELGKVTRDVVGRPVQYLPAVHHDVRPVGHGQDGPDILLHYHQSDARFAKHFQVGQ